MIAPNLSTADRRALVFGAFAIALIVGLGKGAPAIRSWHSARVAIARDLGGQLASARTGAQWLGALNDTAAAATARLDSVRALMLRARSPESAAASLASIVSAILTAKGADVVALNLQADSVVRLGMARVGVRISAETDVAGLAAILVALESRPMPMVLRELSIGQPDPGAPVTKADALRVDLVVQTLARVERNGGRS